MHPHHLLYPRAEGRDTQNLLHLRIADEEWVSRNPPLDALSARRRRQTTIVHPLFLQHIDFFDDLKHVEGHWDLSLGVEAGDGQRWDGCDVCGIKHLREEWRISCSWVDADGDDTLRSGLVCLKRQCIGKTYSFFAFGVGLHEMDFGF